MTLTGILPVRHTVVMFQGSLLAALLPIFSNKSDLDPLQPENGSAVKKREADIGDTYPSDRERKNMKTVSIFKNGNNRAIRQPRDLDFEGVSELEIVREGDSIILRPVRADLALVRRPGKSRSGLYGGARGRCHRRRTG